MNNVSSLLRPFRQLYENFVEEVDAIDNGISQYDGESRYAISSTLSARVAHLNPRWNSKSQDTEVGTCLCPFFYVVTANIFKVKSKCFGKFKFVNLGLRLI